MKRVLITGGKGFIGRNLYEYLQVYYTVFTPSSEQLDLTDENSCESYVRENKIDVIVHSATYTNRRREINKDLELESNLRMYYNLKKLEKMVEKILYFGSGAEFDKTRDIVNIKEEEFGRSIPKNQYGLSKYIMQVDAIQSTNIYNLRLFGVYGKYENWQTCFISNLCCKKMFDLPLSIRQDCSFDFLYIDDLCKIVKWFIENKPCYHDYNICSGKKILLSELAKIVSKENGTNSKIICFSTGYNLEYTGNNERLMSEFSNLTFTNPVDAISDLIDYYSNSKDEIDYNILRKTY